MFVQWEKRNESLTYIFKNELKKLRPTYQDNFLVSNGQHPFIITLYMRKEISLETFSILAKLSNVYDMWEKEIVDKFVAPGIIRLSRKYYPFMEVDTKKFSKIVKEHFFEDK